MSHKVVVQAVSSKEVDTRRGPATTYSFRGDDGQWYKMGFKKPSFNKGDTIEFEFSNTAYGNEVTAILSSPSSPEVAGPAPAKPAYTPRKSFGGGGGAGYSRGVFPIPVTDGQRSIIRQNALTNARELVVALENMTGENITNTTTVQDAFVDAVLRMAKKFEAYTAGDTEAAAARKALSDKSDV